MTTHAFTIIAVMAVTMPLAAHAEEEWASGRAPGWTSGGAASTAATAAGTGAPTLTQRELLVDEGHTPVESATPAHRSMHRDGPRGEATDMRRTPNPNSDRLYTGG